MSVVAEETRIALHGDFDDVQRWFEERGLTDGLPIVPPTEERVAAMLASVPGPADTSLGLMLPRSGNVTLEALAANAVMAGARPEYFPVIVAAVRAILHPEFNHYGVFATTHPVIPVVVVHGPIARELKVHGGTGCLGPGFKANATIGRAIHLIQMNVGGAYPGNGDQATHASPAKYSFCFAENLDESPWPEFHTTRGFDPNESAVTVIGGGSPHNVKDNDSKTPERLLELMADAMRMLATNTWYLAQNGVNEVIAIFCPEHARIIGDAGWSRRDVREFLFERARRTVADLREKGGMWYQRDWPAEMRAQADRGDDVLMPLVRSVDGILVFVAGGPGQHSVYSPGFGHSQSVTVRV